MRFPFRKRARPSIAVMATGRTRYAECAGMVTVGALNARLLTEKLGRKVEAGEVFDLGTLAAFHEDRAANRALQGRIRPNVFNN